jgi:glycosyltransferase involved in cell wall biosynthesis
MRSLVVFLTYGSSLETWKDAGIIDRELAIYEEHAQHGVRVDIISYGAVHEKKIAANYPFIRVHHNAQGLHPRLYALALPALHRHALRTGDIYKTNQAYGSHIASRCARLWRKPWVLRQGYGHYENREKEHGKYSAPAISAKRYEKKYMRLANANITTTDGLAERSVKRHGLDKSEIFVVPNYVVTKNWHPPFQASGRRRPQSFAFVGRLSKEKNLAALIVACEDLPVTLEIIGVGPDEAHLRTLAAELNVKCRFHGLLTQARMRTVIADADVFVLPSLYEGQPKALIEAMTFGIPVLGTDVAGIKDLIDDNQTGVLVKTDVAALRSGIVRYMDMDSATYCAISSHARAWSNERFSIARVAQLERQIFAKVAGNG